MRRLRDSDHSGRFQQGHKTNVGRQRSETTRLRISRGKTKIAEERFWAKVEKDGPTPIHCPQLGPCWIWIGARNRGSYGRFVVARIRSQNTCIKAVAHEYAYRLAKGAIPHGLELDHLCRNPICVNPDHLEAVTHSINVLRQPGHFIDSCPNGHARNDANCYRDRNGYPHCRTCDRDRHRVAYTSKRLVHDGLGVFFEEGMMP